MAPVELLDEGDEGEEGQKTDGGGTVVWQERGRRADHTSSQGHTYLISLMPAHQTQYKLGLQD